MSEALNKKVRRVVRKNFINEVNIFFRSLQAANFTMRIVICLTIIFRLRREFWVNEKGQMDIFKPEKYKSL